MTMMFVVVVWIGQSWILYFFFFFFILLMLPLMLMLPVRRYIILSSSSIKILRVGSASGWWYGTLNTLTAPGCISSSILSKSSSSSSSSSPSLISSESSEIFVSVVADVTAAVEACVLCDISMKVDGYRRRHGQSMQNFVDRLTFFVLNDSDEGS